VSREEHERERQRETKQRERKQHKFGFVTTDSISFRLFLLLFPKAFQWIVEFCLFRFD